MSGRASLRLAAALLAVGMAAAARQGTAPSELPLATLQGGSVQISGSSGNSGGGAELDAEGHLRVGDGSRIELDGAAAQLHLLRGGDIRLCGPARMSLAAGGGGALLVSLEAGGLELRYASPVADSLLTPDFRLTTVVPPEQLATVSASVALQPDGTLCVLNRGSALSVERLWDGTQRYVISGQALAFAPGGGVATVGSCPCAGAAPAAVAAAPDEPSKGAGALFPAAAALTVAATGANGKTTSAPTAPLAGATLAAPPPAHRHNFVVRFLRWFVGKKSN